FAVHEPQRLSINCFYNRKYSPCSFTTNTEKDMEKHYRKEHYQKEAIPLEKLEKMNKLGATYLQAYLLTKSARYANYQTELLANTNFNQAKYLKTLAWELEPLEKQIKAKENLTKQASQTLDTFAHQAIQTMTEALAEKDQIIHELRQKLAEKESENQQLRLLLHTIVLTASQAVNREPEPEKMSLKRIFTLKDKCQDCERSPLAFDTSFFAPGAEGQDITI
ncbi:19233_t:CDS:2, partial [Entrophospora sp. SA101]